jgi:hypothetical protein
MSDPLIERIETLKAKLDDLAAKGADDRELFDLRSHISRLSLAAIVSDLEEEDEAYASATLALDHAIQAIDAATNDASSVETAIRVAAKTVAIVEKAITVVP